MVGHVMGIPIEESVLQLAAAGGALTAAAIAGRTAVDRLRRRLNRRSTGEDA